MYLNPNDIMVNDVRADDDPSLVLVPRIISMADVARYFGLTIDGTYGWDAAPVGALVWAVVGLEVRTGVASYIAQFYRADGSPVLANEVRAARAWPGAQSAANGETLRPNYPGLYNQDGFKTNCGVAGWSNGDGRVGFPYSHGSMIAIGARGPDMIWPMTPAGGSPPQYADCVTGLGWITNTNHLNVNPIYQLVTKTGSPIPPPPLPEGDYLLKVIVHGQEIGYIPIYPPDVPEADNKLVLFGGGVELGTIFIEE